MEKEPKQKSVRVKWIVTAIVLAIAIGPVGIALLGIAGAFYLSYLKQRAQRRTQDDPLAPHMEESHAAAPDYSPSRPSSGGTFDRPAAPRAAAARRPDAQRGAPSGPALPDGQRRRAEELRDLLRAGIIELDEYNDRMRELKTR